MGIQEPTSSDFLLDDVDNFKKYAEEHWDHRTAYEVIQAIENWTSVQDARSRRRGQRSEQPSASTGTG